MNPLLPAPLSMGGVQENPVTPMAPGNKIPIKAKVPAGKKPALDAHQLHMQHVEMLHNAHMQHLKNIGQDPGAINKFLTNDPTYQQQTTAIQKALGDYQAQALQQQNSYNSGYALNRADLDEQRRTSGINQSEDYGSRGMLRSGLYAVDNTDRLNNFAAQQSHLDQQRGDYTMNSQQGVSNYITQQQLASQQARQDAINRRALGLIGAPAPVVKKR